MFKFKELCLPANFDQQTFIIAEIGQNHQGDINTAKKLIEVAKNCGADCVKFQKTDLEEKFNARALERPYVSPNSFGETYGEHKAFLEFSETEFIILQKYANELDIIFAASAMDAHSLKFLAEINVPFIKIGSGDANNYLLIEKAAKTDIPLIISTGMQTIEAVRKIYKIVSKYHKNFALLHCVSAYPTPYEDINLQIVEKHITLNKGQKGSDHKCSLEPHEFKEMVEKIRTLEAAMGRPIKVMQNSELPCYEKLGKTLVYTRDLPKGHQLHANDLNIKVAEPKGIDGAKFDDVIGKILITEVEKDDSVLTQHLN
ncbi:sialic acid synthase isoform X2 [Anoplophora glabripennis]|uniref:sialic acid synthase isoform X2 n=1 Tax=Anoplophora glabripennis TaxID=217634 RepID=UPI0008752450|nr:sialic acid synthase isoform X2 [Anoplophora glabripennis]